MRGGPAVREFVYVSALKGHILDRITGIHDALDRQVYDGGFGDESVVAPAAFFLFAATCHSR